MKTYDEYQTPFQKRLIALREREHLSQSELAIAIRVSRSSVRDWESGDKEPRIELLIRIADYFRVSADYLLGRDSVMSLYIGDVPDEVRKEINEIVRNMLRASCKM